MDRCSAKGGWAEPRIELIRDGSAGARGRMICECANPAHAAISEAMRDGRHARKWIHVLEACRLFFLTL